MDENIKQDEPLLFLKTQNTTFVVCDAQKDSHNIFNCIFQPKKSSAIKFDAYFSISHYYKDVLKIYYSLEPNMLDACLQDNFCRPNILTNLERDT